MSPLTAELALEYINLRGPNQCPLGVCVTPGAADKWHGVLSVHRGYYAGGIFHFTISLARYPHARPVVTFTTPVFHPLIASDGKMALEGRFPTWRAGQHTVSHLLHYIKASFKRTSLDALQEAVCPNKEAYRLYREQTGLFSQLAAQSAELSTTESNLYNAPKQPSPIRFRSLSTEEESRIRHDLFGSTS